VFVRISSFINSVLQRF